MEILSLVGCRDFDPNPEAIALRLGISPHQALMAVKRLLHSGMLVEQNSTLRRRHDQDLFLPKRASEAVRQFQKQMIDKAKAAIDGRPFEERELMGMTLSLKAADLERLKGRLREFRREITSLFSESDNDYVYHVGIQCCRLDFPNPDVTSSPSTNASAVPSPCPLPNSNS